jgi:hypothetical protein
MSKPLWVLVVQKRPSGSIDAWWLRLGGRGSSFSSGLSVFRSGSASDEDFGQQRTADRAQEVQLGPVVLMPRRIWLPNGLFLRYDDPAEDLWGGKLLALPSAATGSCFRFMMNWFFASRTTRSRKPINHSRGNDETSCLDA